MPVIKREGTPNLFLPGAAKSGTTSLHEYLDQHPQICMSRMKEPHLFSRDKQFEAMESVLSRMFPSVQENARYYGESSTSYMVSENAVRRIKEFIEDPKFIFILRNPIDRMYSHYKWLTSLDMERRDFRTAVLDDQASPFDAENHTNGCYKYYFAFSRYGSHLQRYIHTFGREWIHIITTEGLNNAPLETVNSCFRFLGLENLEHINAVHKNETRPLTRENVVSSFIDENKKLVPLSIKKAITKKVDYRKLLQGLFGEREHGVLTQDERVWLSRYLKKDVDLLKTIIGYGFPEWEDFMS